MAINANLPKNLTHRKHAWSIHDNPQGTFRAVLTYDGKRFSKRRIGHAGHGNQKVVFKILERNTTHSGSIKVKTTYGKYGTDIHSTLKHLLAE